ncbi:4'-phosphopantetheinyl transferase superfamily protein [Streptomyces sp. NPDC006645]|uniref:4'-phosphopantetheinyl transferase family protein n=1 Tax=unclassified Streptomyces TaxID=2593676 RepID=UPI0033AB5E90
MIQELLPYGVVGADVLTAPGPGPRPGPGARPGPPPGPGTDRPGDGLLPAERAALGEVAEGRRAEFTDVRRCARRALGELGLGAVPLIPDPDGVPGWPPGVLGSMTHCAGYRAAVVALTRSAHALGVDAEPCRPLRDGVLLTVSLPEERARHADLARERPGPCWDRLLFCAKEAVYKAWFPPTRIPLGFRDVEVTFAPDGHTFGATVLRPAPAGGRREFTGRWLSRHGVLVAAVVVAGEGPGRPG